MKRILHGDEFSSYALQLFGETHMNEDIDFMNREGLKFFGKVNASISHELKNILAIISETAGFLKDLTDLAKQGKDFKLSLLESCTESIEEEIQRGFATIKQMNRFSHSVDVPLKQVDLMEILALMVNLSKFLSSASTVHIHGHNKEIKSVLTCPFLLQNLIYQILCFTYELAGSEGEIHITLDSEKDEGIGLDFSSSAPLSLENFPGKEMQTTAEILGIQLKSNISLNQFTLWVPYASQEMALLAKTL